MARLVASIGDGCLLHASGEDTAGAAPVGGLQRVADGIATLVADGHQVVVVHGAVAIPEPAANRDEGRASPADRSTMSRDLSSAGTQGRVGHLLAQAIETALRSRHLDTPVLAILGRTVLRSAEGGAGSPPGKPPAEAIGDVVGIVEAPSIRDLSRNGVVVIVGAGLLSVVACDIGYRSTGVTVDQDLAAAVLVEALGADALLLLSDADAVYASWGTPYARPISHLSVAYACALAGELSTVRTGRRLAAAAAFSARTGLPAIVVSPDRAADAVQGRGGTVISPSGMMSGVAARPSAAT